MAKHGTLRGLEYVNRSSVASGRFGRMFRALPGETFPEPALRALAKQMIQQEIAEVSESRRPPEPGESPRSGPEAVFNDAGKGWPLDKALGVLEADDENPTIAAGYTYFGQFIDHDLTFDPNSSLERQNDPDATENFRTPRLDLDSLYGRGPDGDPFMYDKTEANYGEFLTGSNETGDRPGDLPRNSQHTALIGDPRNDENRIVSQLHCVFLCFHNKVLRQLRAAFTVAHPEQHVDGQHLFLEAQRLVRWHYQYLVLNDYLIRIVGPNTWRHVLGLKAPPHCTLRSLPPRPNLRFYRPKQASFIPVEFSVAAFRFGHSMIRPAYALGTRAEVGGHRTEPFTGDPMHRFHRIPLFSDVGTADADLRGKQQLPEGWEIDWRLFFGEQPSSGHREKAVVAQLSYRLDSILVDPLAMLPLEGDPVKMRSLAYRNLLRGSAFELPSGENVARFLGVPVVGSGDLWPDGTPSQVFTRRTPLWYYILREAALQRHPEHLQDKLGGHHLGPCGGRIVAEVLVGVVLRDHSSFLHQNPGWTPASEQERSGFTAGAEITTMEELIRWTTDGRMTLAIS